MEYYVIGSDGNEYGPANIPTLQSWVQENRLSPQTTLRDTLTGNLVPASRVPGLFPTPVATTPPPASPYPPSPGMPFTPPTAGTPPRPDNGAWSQPPSASNYPRQAPAGYASDNGSKAVTWAFIDSILGLVFFFALHGLGVIVAAYGLFNAVQAKRANHPLAIAALVVSGLSLLLIIFGYAGIVHRMN